MLLAVETGKYIEDIPHRADFERWRSRLSEPDFQAISAALNERADDAVAGSQVLTAGWIPGNDWASTVYEPIYQTACDQNAEEAGLCFGLFVWVVLQRRDSDVWGFGRYEKDGVPIRSMTYFLVRNPPPR